VAANSAGLLFFLDIHITHVNGPSNPNGLQIVKIPYMTRFIRFTNELEHDSPPLAGRDAWTVTSSFFSRDCKWLQIRCGSGGIDALLGWAEVGSALIRSI
jgi:hypothetical protein